VQCSQGDQSKPRPNSNHVLLMRPCETQGADPCWQDDTQRIEDFGLLALDLPMDDGKCRGKFSRQLCACGEGEREEGERRKAMWWRRAQLCEKLV